MESGSLLDSAEPPLLTPALPLSSGTRILGVHLSGCMSERSYMEVKKVAQAPPRHSDVGRKFRLLATSFCENGTDTESATPHHPHLESKDSETHGGENSNHVWPESCQADRRQG